MIINNNLLYWIIVIPLDSYLSSQSDKELIEAWKSHPDYKPAFNAAVNGAVSTCLSVEWKTNNELMGKYFTEFKDWFCPTGQFDCNSFDPLDFKNPSAISNEVF